MLDFEVTKIIQLGNAKCKPKPPDINGSNPNYGLL